MRRSPTPDTRAARPREAAPAGGARFAWCRGCALGLVLALSWPPATGMAQAALPSGQIVTLAEVLLDEAPGALWVRFRFVAPEVAREGGTVDAQAALADLDALCQQIAVPYVSQYGLAPERVVVSLSDRMVEFGATDPDATQFFELFSIQDARCIWEEF